MRFRVLAAATLAVATGGPARATPAPAPASATAQDGPLVVTVRWEGMHLQTANIQALAKLRQEFPSMRVTHLVDPVYFLRRGTSAMGHPVADPRAILKSAVLPGDGVGVYLHAWKSITDVAGVTFRTGPTFWGRGQTGCGEHKDCGHDVPLTAYTPSEVVALARVSRETLESQGFQVGPGFAVGGFLSNPEIRAALRQNGFAIDYSLVSSDLVRKALRNYPLHKWIEKSWGGIDTAAASQEETSFGHITLVPSHIGTFDYVAGSQVEEIFRRRYTDDLAVGIDAGSMPTRLQTRTDPFHMSITFETIAQTYARIVDSFHRIFRAAAQTDIEVAFGHVDAPDGIPLVVDGGSTTPRIGDVSFAADSRSASGSRNATYGSPSAWSQLAQETISRGGGLD